MRNRGLRSSDWFQKPTNQEKKGKNPGRTEIPIIFPIPSPIGSDDDMIIDEGEAIPSSSKRRNQMMEARENNREMEIPSTDIEIRWVGMRWKE